MYIDTHCHLSKEDYDDIDKVIEDNKINNVDKIIISIIFNYFFNIIVIFF